MSVAAYLPLRVRSVGLYHSLDLVEWGDGFEVPVQVTADPWFASLRAATAETVALMNDIHSAAREASRNDPHNLVLILRRDGLSPAKARATAADYAQQALDRFVTLADQEPQVARRHHLDAAGTQAVHAAVEGCRTWIRGNDDWAHTSGRYHAGCHQPRYLDDLVSHDRGGHRTRRVE